MKTYLKLFLLVAMLFITVNATGSKLPQKQSGSGVTNEYKAAVIALLDATKSENSMRESLISLFTQYGLEASMANAIVDELTKKMSDIMANIYSHHFSLDEIKQLIKLNQDEVRQKFNTLQPQLSQEMIQEAQCYASGQASPLADITVSSDFDAAMREYLVAEEFDKTIEMLTPILMQDLGSQEGLLDKYYEALPDMMVRIYSKYFTASDIRHLISQSNLPCAKKFREKTPAIAQECMVEMQKAIYDILHNQLSQ